MKSVHFFKYIILLGIIFMQMSGKSQTPRFAMQDLDELFAKLRLDTNVNFSATYYIEEDDSANVVLYDTLQATVKLRNNNYYADFGKYLRISNAYFSMLLDTLNKEMYVDFATENVGQIINLKITDENYYKAYIDSIYYTNPTLKDEIVIGFNEYSPYYYYKIKFNYATKSIVSVEYAMRKEIQEEVAPPLAPNPNAPSTPGPSSRMKIVFTTYTNTNVPSSDFDLSIYFRNTSNGMLPTPAYAAYQIINLTQPNQ